MNDAQLGRYYRAIAEYWSTVEVWAGERWVVVGVTPGCHPYVAPVSGGRAAANRAAGKARQHYHDVKHIPAQEVARWIAETAKKFEARAAALGA